MWKFCLDDHRPWQLRQRPLRGIGSTIWTSSTRCSLQPHRHRRRTRQPALHRMPCSISGSLTCTAPASTAASMSVWAPTRASSCRTSWSVAIGFLWLEPVVCFTIFHYAPIGPMGLVFIFMCVHSPLVTHANIHLLCSPSLRFSAAPVPRSRSSRMTAPPIWLLTRGTRGCRSRQSRSSWLASRNVGVALESAGHRGCKDRRASPSRTCSSRTSTPPWPPMRHTKRIPTTSTSRLR